MHDITNFQTDASEQKPVRPVYYLSSTRMLSSIQLTQWSPMPEANALAYKCSHECYSHENLYSNSIKEFLLSLIETASDSNSTERTSLRWVCRATHFRDSRSCLLQRSWALPAWQVIVLLEVQPLPYGQRRDIHICACCDLCLSAGSAQRTKAAKGDAACVSSLLWRCQLCTRSTCT